MKRTRTFKHGLAVIGLLFLLTAMPVLAGDPIYGEYDYMGSLNADNVFKKGGVTVTSSAAELNILDGCTATVDDLNNLGSANSGSFTVTNALNASVLSVYGGETNGASIKIFADNDDNATDGWAFNVDTSGNLNIQNDSTAAGTFLTKVTISSSGDITKLVGGDIAINGINIDMGEATTNVLAFTATSTTFSGDITPTGGDIAGKSGTGIDLGEATVGQITFTGTNFNFVGGLRDDGKNVVVGPSTTTLMVQSGTCTGNQTVAFTTAFSATPQVFIQPTATYTGIVLVAGSNARTNFVAAFDVGNAANWYAIGNQ